MSEKEQRWTMPYRCPSCGKESTKDECRFCGIPMVENDHRTSR